MRVLEIVHVLGLALVAARVLEQSAAQPVPEAHGQQCLLSVGSRSGRAASATEDPPAPEVAQPAAPAAAGDAAKATSTADADEVRAIKAAIARSVEQASDKLGDAVDDLAKTLKEQAKAKSKDIKEGRHFFYMEDETCTSGQMQSPINIQMTQVVLGQFAEDSELLPRLNFTAVTGVEVANKAHYIEVTPLEVNATTPAAAAEPATATDPKAGVALSQQEPSEDASKDKKKDEKPKDPSFGTFRLPNGTGSAKYEAKWLRFSVPSHHSFNYMLTSGELHIVCQKEGSKDSDDLAVIAVMLQDEALITDDLLQIHGEAMKQQKDLLTTLGFAKDGFPARDEKKTLPDAKVDLMSTFANCFTGSYFHYKGSLATPPCSQNVHWYVLQKPAAISADMVTAYYEAFGGSPTNRPVQPVNGREVAQNKISFLGEFDVAAS